MKKIKVREGMERDDVNRLLFYTKMGNWLIEQVRSYKVGTIRKQIYSSFIAVIHSYLEGIIPFMLLAEI